MSGKRFQKKLILRYKKNGIRLKMYIPRERIHNCIWIFTIGDADDQPSIPHAHSQEEGYKLNAWTGEIYPAGSERKNVIGQVGKKELLKLYKDKKFLKFAKKQIEWYRMEYPHISFFVPEWFELKYLTVEDRWLKETENIDTYIFVGKTYIK